MSMDFNVKNCLRTAAIVYAEGGDYAVKRNTTIRKYIEAVFTLNGNSELSLLDLVSIIEADYKINFTETEILSVIKSAGEKIFLICDATRQDETKISLTKERFLHLSSRVSQLDFQNILNEFIAKDNLNETVEQLENLLCKYFYHLLNTNVDAYSQILNPASRDTSIVVPSESFSEDEQKIINDFLDWENNDKNKQIVCLISLAIEFAFLSNNVDARQYCKSLSNKWFCLDTNLIFRGLGINGKSRKKRVDVFLNKCLHSGQKLIITKFTRDEFFSSIEYKISILKKYPFGKSNPEIFAQYGGSEFYNFYHEWRKERVANSISYFEIYLKNLYKSFCENYKILEELAIPFDQEQDETRRIVEKYTLEIKDFKSERRQVPAKTDALNVLFVEKKRNGNDLNIIDTKYYLITADHGLKKWDDTHSSNQPIMLLPSQWLGLIFKYTGRATEDDFQCFMSFLRLKTEKQQLIDADRLQIIVAGISEISNDFSEQKNLVDEIIHSRSDLLRCQDEVAYTEVRDFALQKVIKRYQSEADTQKQACNNAVYEYNNGLYEYRKRRISDIQNYTESILRRKEKADRKAKKIRFIRRAIVCTIALPYFIIIVLGKFNIIPLEWDLLALYSVGEVSLQFFASCFWGKKIHLEDFYKVLQLEFITKAVYEEYDINTDELNDLEREKTQLIAENASWENRKIQE